MRSRRCPFRRSACTESIDQKRGFWINWRELGRPGWNIYNYHCQSINLGWTLMWLIYATEKNRAHKSKGCLGFWACFWVNWFQWVGLSSTARTVTLITDSWRGLMVARDHFTSGHCNVSLANWGGIAEVIPCNGQRLYGECNQMCLLPPVSRFRRRISIRPRMNRLSRDMTKTWWWSLYQIGCIPDW
jgi:hypothetical protein